MQQEVVLAMLAKELSQGYQPRPRLDDALGPLGEALNAGQIYVTLGRLEKAGLISLDGRPGTRDRGRKIYALTPLGQERVSQWLGEVSWPKPDLAELHLKLIAAAPARLADPISEEGMRNIDSLVDQTRLSCGAPGKLSGLVKLVR